MDPHRPHFSNFFRKKSPKATLGEIARAHPSLASPRLSVHQLCYPLTVPAFTFCSLSPPSKRDLYHSREACSPPPPALRYTLPLLGLSHLRQAYKGQPEVALMPYMSSYPRICRGWRGGQEGGRWAGSRLQGILCLR